MLKKKTAPRKKSMSGLKSPLVLNRSKKVKPFTIVAIGASAGGLEAVSDLLKNLAVDTGMAFIYVQHLSPDHRSFLTAILSKVTKMKVQEVENMAHIAPNNVYVIPNDKGIQVTDGHIRLLPRPNGATAISIDVLFTSLAQTHKKNVIGVVLSGNAQDGTLGLKAIREAGGITMAQDRSAQVGSMPQSAIASGMVDFILSPRQMALELMRIGNNGSAKRRTKQFLQAPEATGSEFEIKDQDPNLKVILEILHKKVNVDFSLYKMATIKRRVMQRMAYLGLKTVKQYALLLAKKNTEVSLLYKDLLINVTNFFRDTDTFRYLKATFLPKLLKTKTREKNLRIWVPACSTGEEAYSIAILVTELLDKIMYKIPVQIFATDLSEQAIRYARIGEYSENDLKLVSKKRIERFFIKSGDRYQIVKELRQMCVFAPHNVLRDPPFSRIDFISCRNLLIYFDANAQKKVLATLSFALNPGGFLMLGKSETIGTSSAFFTQLNHKFRIYSQKKSVGLRKLPDLLPRFPLQNSERKEIKVLPKKKSVVSLASLDSVIDAALLADHMPACAIINKDMEILKFRGSTSMFLSHASGSASLNILKMMRPEFSFELRNAIHQAIDTNKAVIKSDIELEPAKEGSVPKIMSLEVNPLKFDGGEALLLVVFRLHEQTDKYFKNDPGIKGKTSQMDLRIKKQAAELSEARTEMLTVFESQQKAYEELQVANEEIVSVSEEFQTLNEELETSKEEIEATNEELLTTNQELQVRNDQLAEASNFSEALAETMHEPMLILDKNLRIKSVNKAFYKKFMLSQAGTVGKLLYELGDHQWDILRLRELLENIIQKGTPFYDYEITHDFAFIGRKTMLLNATLIVQKTLQEQLILLTFIDTTESHQRQKLESKKLEDIISARTADLADSHKALEKKNVSLEKINKELETFNFISSHDLQEPLRKIKMFSSSLIREEEEKLSGLGKKYLHRMHRTVNRMQMLIDDLLVYSQIKNKSHDFKQVDLHKVLKEVIDDFSEALEEKNGTITVNGPIKADIVEFQFRQLMFNLISNSLKFTDPKREPRIVITAKPILGNMAKHVGLLPKAKYCHITFTDNGIGFDPIYKDRIFVVFQRLHGQNKYGGTGIGLAICKRIIENHEGLMLATGKLNEGVCFDIYIPSSGLSDLN